MRRFKRPLSFPAESGPILVGSPGGTPTHIIRATQARALATSSLGQSLSYQRIRVAGFEPALS